MSFLRWACAWFFLVLPVKAEDGKAATGSAPAIQLRSFQLEDQFGKTHALTFPSVKPVLLMVADREGFQQVNPWVEALKAQYQERITIHGVADVSPVPRFLRNAVRNKIKKEVTHPVLLDWGGEVVRSVRPNRGEVNVMALDLAGRVVHSTSGQANQVKLRELAARFDKLLAQERRP